jgi:hypothetical protein
MKKESGIGLMILSICNFLIRMLTKIKIYVCKESGMLLVYDGFVKLFKNLSNGHEFIKATNSVGVLVYIKETGQVVLVKQNRPAMEGITDERGTIFEIVAGRFDIKIGVKGLVVKELQEEIGANVLESQVEVLNSGEPVALSPGVLTERMYLTFVAISLDQIEQKDRLFGNPDEGEKIKRILMPSWDFIIMKHQDMKTMATAMYLVNYLQQIPKFLR